MTGNLTVALGIMLNLLLTILLFIALATLAQRDQLTIRLRVTVTTTPLALLLAQISLLPLLVIVRANIAQTPVLSLSRAVDMKRIFPLVLLSILPSVICKTQLNQLVWAFLPLQVYRLLLPILSVS